MAKQMHQIDDDENPGKGGFFTVLKAPISANRSDHCARKHKATILRKLVEPGSGTVSLAWGAKILLKTGKSRLANPTELKNPALNAQDLLKDWEAVIWQDAFNRYFCRTDHRDALFALDACQLYSWRS